MNSQFSPLFCGETVEMSITQTTKVYFDRFAASDAGFGEST